MEILEAIKSRRSVRSYNDKKIEGNDLEELQTIINQCNKESGLNIQLILNQPEAFNNFIAKYGKFENANNYIAIVGKKSENLEEDAGYYGEKIVLKATQLGLGSCWVAGSYSKGKVKSEINDDEKLVVVISLGYFGKNPDNNRKTKSIEELSETNNMPEWFRSGMEAVQLAPTAMNQQKFLITLEKDNIVKAEIKGLGFFTKIDLGIVKYHFEVGAGNLNFKWA